MNGMIIVVRFKYPSNKNYLYFYRELKKIGCTREITDNYGMKLKLPKGLYFYPGCDFNTETLYERAQACSGDIEGVKIMVCQFSSWWGYLRMAS